MVTHLEHQLNRSIYSLADVVKFNKINPPREGYDQSTLIIAEKTDGLLNKTYTSALLQYQEDSVHYLDTIFDVNEVDALATPCYSNDTPLLYAYGAAAGYPSITVS